MEHWEQRLSNSGFRVTAPRRAIMAVLQASRQPMAPQGIMQRAADACPSLGLVTVYRALALFAELGLVRRVHHADGCHGYLTASPGHHHAILCQCCGRAVEFSGSHDLDVLIARLERETGYQVDEHLLQLVGTCQACRQHDAPTSPPASRE
jgi:Fe2+ or Zn2+ uptake regulation protein